MARAAQSFRRGGPKYKPTPTVLVVCEDSKSSKLYLEEATVHFRIRVQVEVAHCGNTDPKGIVNYAIQRRNKFDLIFCVIDRDTHESFDEALRTAREENNVRLIVSYPCFEFWYLLHFGHTTKPYVRKGKHSAGDSLNLDLKKCEGMADYDKSMADTFSRLLPRFEAARGISPKVLQSAIDNKEMNPSTEVHILMDHFESMEAPDKF